MQAETLITRPRRRSAIAGPSWPIGVDGSEEVDVDDPAPLVGRGPQCLGHAVAHDASAVDEHLDRPDPLHLGRQPRDGGRVGDVAGVPDDIEPVSDQLLGGLADPVRVLTDDDDREPALREAGRGSASDAAAAAGHEGDS